MARRPLDGAPETSVQRLARRAEEDRQEMRAGFANIMESIESIRTEIRRGAQDSDRLEKRFDDLEWQVNLTRDEVQRRAVNPAPSQIASAKVALQDFSKSWLMKAIASGIAILTFLSLLNNIPDAQRVVEKFWAFTRELDQPAKPVAKVDPKH